MSDERLEELKCSPGVLDVYKKRLKLKKESGEWVAVCPFHTEKTGSFHVYQHESTYLYKCFGCGKAGNVFQFVERYDRVSLKAAIAVVRDIVGGNDDWEKTKRTSDETFKPLQVEEKAKEAKVFTLAVYDQRLGLQKDGAGAEWLQKERGITFDTARQLHIGFKQDIGKAAGERNADVANKGWMVFPCIEDDKVVSIKFRSIVRKAFARVSGMGTALFNTNDIEPLEPVFLVEGEPDAAVLKQAGFAAVSLPSGSTKLDAHMKDQLMGAECIYLAGDCDGGVGDKAMAQAQKVLQDGRAFLLKWPEGMKDANQTFLEYCKRDVDKFRQLVEQTVARTKAQPMQYMYSLPEVMVSSSRTNLLDHPQRLRFPWKRVDDMAILLPGSVTAVIATNTKMGKTAWVMNVTLEAARRQGEIVLNYQCELSEDEFSNMVAAYVLSKDRNQISTEDYKVAAAKLAGVKYYVGRNPNLSTAGPVLDLIEAGIKRLAATVVVLDHIHFICRNVDNEIQEQANAMQRITRMAQQYGVKFIVVSQPRKALQQNRGKAIHITDIKGSETLSSDVHAAFAIHRDYVSDKEIDPANPPDDAYRPETDVKLMASRFKGPGGAFTRLMFHGKFAAFRDEIPQSAVPVEIDNRPKSRQSHF